MPIQPQSLDKVIDLATRRRDEAGRQLALALGQLQQAQAQWQQLTDYTAEGAAKWQARSALGVSGVLLQHRRTFDEKLQEAIRFQEQVIQQQQDAVNQRQQALQACERELSTLKKVRERAEQEAALRQRRREQKQIDEMAMSMLAYQRRQAETEITP